VGKQPICVENLLDCIIQELNPLIQSTLAKGKCCVHGFKEACLYKALGSVHERPGAFIESSVLVPVRHLSNMEAEPHRRSQAPHKEVPSILLPPTTLIIPHLTSHDAPLRLVLSQILACVKMHYLSSLE